MKVELVEVDTLAAVNTDWPVFDSVESLDVLYPFVYLVNWNSFCKIIN